MRFGVLVAAAAAAFCTTQPVSAGGGYQGINFVFPDIPPAGLTSAERDFFREVRLDFAPYSFFVLLFFRASHSHICCAPIMQAIQHSARCK
jgi:hypothetical protein